MLGSHSLVAANLHHTPDVHLQPVKVLAGRTFLQVAFNLFDLAVRQLTVDVPVELFYAVIAVHALSPFEWTIPDSRA